MTPFAISPFCALLPTFTVSVSTPLALYISRHVTHRIHISLALVLFTTRRNSNPKVRTALALEPPALLPLAVAAKVVRVGLARDPGAELDGPLHEAGRALQAQQAARHLPQDLLVPDARRLPQVELLRARVYVRICICDRMCIDAFGGMA